MLRAYAANTDLAYDMDAVGDKTCTGLRQILTSDSKAKVWSDVLSVGFDYQISRAVHKALGPYQRLQKEQVKKICRTEK